MKPVHRLLSILVCILLFTFSACGKQSSQEPANSINGESGQVVTADDESKTEELTALFEEGVSRIYCLSINEPILILEDVFGDVQTYRGNSDIIFVTDTSAYFRTSLKYSDVSDYYGEIFADEALEWILSTRYLDVDGVLYCSSTGGATGVGIYDVSIEKVGENAYIGTFHQGLDMNNPLEVTSRFEVTATDAGYRISSIDYCPSFLKQS